MRGGWLGSGVQDKVLKKWIFFYTFPYNLRFFHLFDNEGEHDGDELEDDTDRDVDVDADDLCLAVWIWMDSGQDNCILWSPRNWLKERKRFCILVLRLDHFADTVGQRSRL